MPKLLPTTLTIEEAVALMIGLDYIPTGFTVLDMTSAFLEESEADLETNRNSDAGQRRHEVCLARHQLASTLLDALTYEALEANSGNLVRSDDTSPTQRFTTTSLNNWAQDRFGITLWAPSMSDGQPKELAGVTWQDVTIKIYTDHRVGYCVKDGRYKTSSFHDMGLMGVRKQVPSTRGLILIGLSEGKKFPSCSRPSAAHKTSISIIRAALKKLVSLDGEDPFYAYNPGDGWKPKFKLIDDRRNAAERAKNAATHVPLEPEARDFEDENDPAGQFLKNHGNR